MKRKSLTTSATLALVTATLTVVTIFATTLTPAAPSSPGAQNQSPASSQKASRPAGDSAAQTPVNPLAGLPDLIDNYEAPLTNEADAKARMAQTIADWTAAKKVGVLPRWAQPDRMKPPEYYAALDTTALADACFEGGLFGNVMLLYKREASLENLRIFHNGFAELLQRPDMWKGILQLYDKLGAKIDPQADPRQIVDASLQLDEMRNLITLPPLKDQVKGKEDQFLAAQVRVLQRFKRYLDTFEPREGWQTPGFFREPCSVAQVALLLAKQVDPQGYDKIIPALMDVRWSREQHTVDLRKFIDLVLDGLSRISVKGDRK
jgi:hypothetical protein